METIKDVIALGKHYFESKQYQRAEHILCQVIEKHPNYADVLNLLGVINHIDGKFEAAITFFRRALKINPRYTEAILNLAILYNDLGQYAEAKRLYTQLRGQRQKEGGVEVEPVLRGKLSNLHAEIGDIYRSIGLSAHAIEEYRKALHLNPNYHDIRTKLGTALREDGQLAASKKELEGVIKADEGYAPARVQLGVTHYSMGKVDEAKRIWKTVLSQNPADDHAKMYLRLCEVTGQPEETRAPSHAVIAKKKVSRKKPGSRAST